MSAPVKLDKLDVPAEPDPAVLQRDVENIRSDLDRLVGELDHRRHELFDLRLQLRRHALPIGLAAAALVVGGGAVALLLVRRRRRALQMASWAAKLGRLKIGGVELGELRDALIQARNHSQRSGREPSAPRQIGAAGASAAASVAARAVAQRLVRATTGHAV
jgi:hypothetical protein